MTVIRTRILLSAMLVANLSVSGSGQGPRVPTPYVPTTDPSPENIPILATDMWGLRVVRFTDMGGTNWETGPAGAPDPFTAPWHFNMDCSGRIYVADRDAGRIVRMDDLSGTGWKSFSGVGSKALVSAGNMVKDVYPDRSGRIYITTGSSVAQIDDMDGKGFTVWGPKPSGPGSFNNPKTVIQDAQGRLLISDTDNHRIVRADDITGKGWTTFGSEGSGVGQFERPEGLAVDALGRIYITDNNNHRIVRIDDMTGAGWVSFGSFGAVDSSGTGAVGQFSEPHDIAVSDAMKIYVSDTGNGRIVRLDDMAGRGWFTFGRQTKQGPQRPECPGGNCTPPGRYEFIAAKGLRIDPTYLNVPDAPSALVASPGKTTLTLSWIAPQAQATSYLLELGISPGAADITTIETGDSKTTVTLTSVGAGTYYIRVRAKTCGRSTPSNEVTVVM